MVLRKKLFRITVSYWTRFRNYSAWFLEISGIYFVFFAYLLYRCILIILLNLNYKFNGLTHLLVVLRHFLFCCCQLIDTFFACRWKCLVISNLTVIVFLRQAIPTVTCVHIIAALHTVLYTIHKRKSIYF